ncbi:MAG: NAD(P)-dependent oxidoreductase, partial [Candidatus Bipolaricaulia bacterium]
KRDISKGAEYVDRLFPPEELDELLRRSDFVVVLTPRTPETEGLIGERELRLMKGSAYLIVISRGGIVDEQALAKALRRGELAGAGLDVFATEPLPEESPLWEMEQVIISPHLAGASPHYMERAMEIFAENLRRYLEGRSLKNLVDKERGY